MSRVGRLDSPWLRAIGEYKKSLSKNTVVLDLFACLHILTKLDSTVLAIAISNFSNAHK